MSDLSPSLVVLDLNLPGVDGFDVCRSIRSDPNLKRTRILAITGYAVEESKLKALEAGADEFLAKPLEINNLKEKLQVLYAAR